MHMQLLNNDRVVIYDRTDFGLSNLSLPNGRCRHNPDELVVKTDCTAHSVEYDVATNTFRALFIQSDVWCSSGSVSLDGTLVQTGGSYKGELTVRTFLPCPECDWVEFNHSLVVPRWYSTNHILPDGRHQIIIGGRKQYNFEFYPKNSKIKNTYSLPLLAQTHDVDQENNLYPFVFLNVDGNLFIFANNRAILFNYNSRQIVRTYPSIPGGEPRNYPSTGSAVLLPLKNISHSSQPLNVEAEVMICGGAPRGSYLEAHDSHRFLGALNTCARIKITDTNPKWSMETMPGARIMSDMVMLPNGNVLLINGASAGTAGWKLGRNPVLNPFLYKPNFPVGSRFEVQNPTRIPRMYHSTAILLRDGRVIVAGSNPHEFYEFGKNVLFPTELSLEAFSPSYLEPRFSDVRPRIVSPAPQPATKVMHGQGLRIQFQLTATLLDPNSVSVTMLAPPFNTHSFSMNQRMLVLETNGLRNVGESMHEVEVSMPSYNTLAPPGFYIVFVVHQEIPSEGIWIQIL
ncbi:aldehyde oxidase GLOX1-like [Lotus japonicus]|uniref:aldehyde oxidase GLOX1-like n=1 Tax=Lotus japonicus TaxID=34305 RepID=UPI002587872F|nr:aldehyde oxidase GLOX1-like [Lotus japonicus]